MVTHPHFLPSPALLAAPDRPGLLTSGVEGKVEWNSTSPSSSSVISFAVSFPPDITFRALFLHSPGAQLGQNETWGLQHCAGPFHSVLQNRTSAPS